MNKHTLLTTTGASPQVVTETLYAIHHENLQWPDDIYLITTSLGKGIAFKGLLEDGHLQRLCGELNRPMPAFDASHVLVTPGADGTEVEDARSRADHEALANFIMTEVRNRTASPDTTLHASLAGGRKTMTFYIGYAMSLFGRAQDTLSHVLVSEGYENLRGFWFPTQAEPHRNVVDNKGKTLDASAAEVTLAPIPFIRHRRNLPQVLLQNSTTVKFADLVELINLGENPEDIRLGVDLTQKALYIHDSNRSTSLSFKPGLLDLAFYSMMARATKSGDSELTRPQKGEFDKGFARILVNELLLILGLKSKGSLESDADMLKDADLGIPDRSLDALTKGMGLTWFDSRQTSLRERLERDLPGNLLRWVLPSIIWAEDGSRLPMSDIEKTPKGGGYGLPLKSQQIQIVEPEEHQLR
ncbi:MAG: TIGR02584 family CRISPR-associated protein [Burkholderiaceae bacterium]|jgi:CRISPR-associated protein (TIGR02584 family)|nr:TIGR02584 family CRISPR-associated protein [Burkholderiaceae bacterium]